MLAVISLNASSLVGADLRTAQTLLRHAQLADHRDLRPSGRWEARCQAGRSAPFRTLRSGASRRIDPTRSVRSRSPLTTRQRGKHVVNEGLGLVALGRLGHPGRRVELNKTIVRESNREHTARP
jgi:hypothetical protein